MRFAYVSALLAVVGCGGSSGSSGAAASDPCASVICTAIDACHLPGACDPATGACSTPIQPDGHPCDDGDACTLTDGCRSGACVGGSSRDCPATGPCRVAGVCNPATGACTSPPAPDGTRCDDGSACTSDDACRNGSCRGTDAVTCSAPDACHVAGLCDPATGACRDPSPLDGASCELAGGLGVCRSGSCATAEGLEGSYHVHELSAGSWNGWDAGTVSLSAAGRVTDFFESSSDGTFTSAPTFQEVAVDAAGRITVPGYKDFWGSVSGGGAEAFVTYPDRSGSAIFSVYQRQATGVTAADLAGSWDVHALLVGVGPWGESAWYRGRAAVGAAGGTSRELVDSAGVAWTEEYATTTSPSGRVDRWMGFDTSRRGQGAISPSRQLLASAWTPLDGGSGLELAVRLGAAPRPEDLAGDWSFHVLVAAGDYAYRTGAGHGAFAVDPAGRLSTVYQRWSAADLAIPDGPLEVGTDGRVLLAAWPSFRGSLSADGALLVATFSLDGGAQALLAAQRRTVGPVRPVLELPAAASATIGEAGGTVLAVASDGTRYQLDLPPGAVAQGTTVDVSMTPIADLPALPVNGALLGAVQLAPEGLVLLQPATLSVTCPAGPPPEVIGFGYPGLGLDRADFLPARVPGPVVVDVLHFSGAGVAGGSAAGQADSDSAFMDQLGVVAQVQGVGAAGALGQVMDAWLDAIVADVSRAAGGGSLDLLMNVLGSRLGNWTASLQLLGLGEALCSDEPDRAASLKAVLDVAVPSLIEDIETACKASPDPCGKLAALRKLSDYNAVVQRFGATEPCLGLQETPVCGACGPAGDALPVRAGIGGGTLGVVTGAVGQTVQLDPTFRGICGNDVGAGDENPGGALPEWGSTRPGVASVDELGAVTFRDVGEAAIWLRPRGMACFKPPASVRAVGYLTARFLVRVTQMTILGGGGCSLVTGPPASYGVWLEIDTMGWVTLTLSNGGLDEYTIGRAGLPPGILAFRTQTWNPYIAGVERYAPANLIEREWHLEGNAKDGLRGYYRWGWSGEATPAGTTGCQGVSSVVLDPW